MCVWLAMAWSALRRRVTWPQLASRWQPSARQSRRAPPGVELRSLERTTMRAASHERPTRTQCGRNWHSVALAGTLPCNRRAGFSSTARWGTSLLGQPEVPASQRGSGTHPKPEWSTATWTSSSSSRGSHTSGSPAEAMAFMNGPGRGGSVPGGTWKPSWLWQGSMAAAWCLRRCLPWRGGQAGTGPSWRPPRAAQRPTTTSSGLSPPPSELTRWWWRQGPSQTSGRCCQLARPAHTSRWTCS
mmetsp:Transcript_40817/g.115474  ORF Transcript_40817/g.115474 Transcript_40817/m.115474 type:complete len:243 (-) Transcript_40817:345-1073(-)